MTENSFISKPRLAVIDYGMGNLRSVVRLGAHWRGCFSCYGSQPDCQRRCPNFSWQGAIFDTMRLLQSTGFDNMIRDWIVMDKPFWYLQVCKHYSSIRRRATLIHSASSRAWLNDSASILVILRSRFLTWAGIQLLSTQVRQ